VVRAQCHKLPTISTLDPDQDCSSAVVPYRQCAVVGLDVHLSASGLVQQHHHLRSPACTTPLRIAACCQQRARPGNAAMEFSLLLKHGNALGCLSAGSTLTDAAPASCSRATTRFRVAPVSMMSSTCVTSMKSGFRHCLRQGTYAMTQRRWAGGWSAHTTADRAGCSKLSRHAPEGAQHVLGPTTSTCRPETSIFAASILTFTSPDATVAAP
jgi:hypothetical protein